MASAEEIKRQTAARGVQKGRITRIKNYIDTYNIQDQNFQILQVKYDNLMNAWHKYDECQLFLETNCEDEVGYDRISLEDIVDELRSKIQKLLDTKNEPEASSNKSIDNSLQGNSSVMLPQINLPIFDGSYADWLSFSEFFKMLVHDNASLTTIQKFHYLTSSLTGQAKQLIKNLSLTPDNYEVAWNLLENRYANKRLIASNHANDVINIPSLSKESAQGLASFIDKVSSNINALKALDINFSEFILLQTLSRRLDPNTNRAWESSLSSDEFPSIDDFITFLEKRRQILENTCNSNVSANPQNKALPAKGISNFPRQHSQTYNAQTNSNFDKKYACLCCQENHALHKCHKFSNMTVNDRLFFIRQNRLCFNCFNSNHIVKECYNSYRCKICNSNHHTLIHFDRPAADQNPLKGEGAESGGSYCGLKTHQVSRVLLATAVVTLLDNFNQPVRCRALLDPGSQANFVSESLAHRLNLKREPANLSISGISNISARAKHSINVSMSSLSGDFSANLICFVLPKITGEIPSSDIDISHWAIPSEIKLADKEFNISGKIDLLIGAEIFLQLLMSNQIIQGNELPVLQETKLGWIISGRLPEKGPNQLREIKCHVASLVSNGARNLQCQLQKFWEIEEVREFPCRSKEDEICEEHFRENTIKDKSGRFVVKLPRRMAHPPLGKSLLNAENRFFNLERKLDKNQKLKCDYVKFMNEYLDLDHMQRVENTYSISESNISPYYLPHHAVFKESSSTTKTRVVFDASAKTSNNVSLNDILLTGPTIQQEIISIITRFRTHAYVMTADITKMYRQIRVHSDDYDLQRILWRDDRQQEIGHYQLKTVTYGTAPAAFLATRCLAQLAEENAEAFPFASEIIKRDFYVDDLQTGGDDIKQVKQLQEDLSKILERSGFHLHKWCSNDRRLIEGIPQNKREVNTSIALEEEKTIKTLGLLWDHENDVFKFDISIKPLELNYTKRMVLSIIASIYDILGLLGPFVTACKIFMQRLWLHNLNWDERLPEDLRSTWIELYKQIPMLKEISIPRFVKTLGKVISIQIHGFSDASESAYGASIYLRTVNSNSDVSVKLLCSKSRVAPIKQISLPRLELCGALILSKLVKRILPILCLKIENVYLWTDSTVVLAWLSATPTKWKTFVGNRVSDIQSITENYHWNHVSSQDNPADILSRGALPSKLLDSCLWWEGPHWLKLNKEEWPRITHTIDCDTNLEVRSILVCNSDNSVWDPSRNFSSMPKMLRVMSYVFKFINIVKNPSVKVDKVITVKELENTLERLIRQVQIIHFHEEVKNLKNNSSVSKGSSIASLHPFLDNIGCLRVGGRLENSNLEYEYKHQLILPSKANLTKLIIKTEHERLLHGGTQMIHSSLRQKYWIINARTIIRSVLHRCIKCFRFKATESKQLMGQLPRDRVQISRPFLNVGVDYAGPLIIRQGGRRSKITTKCYVAVFICLATKAIHMEIVSDLTTEAFLAALRRFVSRRGLPSNIYSDNGTNFVGANNALRSIYTMLKESGSEIVRYSSNEGISWHFIPPNSPHFGGLWEAGVKSMKYHLRRIMGKLILSYEELNTIMAQIEACLNSRPICQLSSDPSDPQALTPGHFLIGVPITSLPSPDITHIPVNRLNRWQLIQQCVQQLWSRWSTDYLGQLQQRSKWRSTSSNIQPGRLVLVKEERVPPLHWKLAVIEEVHLGPDNLIRVATVRTASGNLKRSINKLCLLPLNDDEPI